MSTLPVPSVPPAPTSSSKPRSVPASGGDPGAVSLGPGSPDPEAPPLHALLVGIERYPDSDLYLPLEGCSHDVAAMERYLVEVLEVPPSRIDKLVAGQGESTERLPTYRHLAAALRQLEERCGPGEHALVHYSGHGGRTPTAFRDLKGLAAKDECLVPMDIARDDTPYLRDAELDLWIRRLVARDVFVTLVLDCCHSGGIRRDREPRVRGGKRPDPLPKPLGLGLISKDEWERWLSRDGSKPPAAWNGGVEGVLEAGSRPRPSLVFRHAGLSRASDEASRGYALFAACRHWEKAREDVFDGVRPSGALTYFLLQALQRLGQEATYRQLHEAVVAGVHGRFREQTPVFEGEVRALPLGHRQLPRTWGSEVLDVIPPIEPDERSRVLLAVGRCQGVAEGARFGIHPLAEIRQEPGEPRGEEPGRPGPGKPRITVTVEKAGATSCRAVLEAEPYDGIGVAAVRPGDRAVWLDPGSRELRWRVALPRPSVPAEAELVAELTRRLQSDGSVRLALAEEGAAETGAADVSLAFGTADGDLETEGATQEATQGATEMLEIRGPAQTPWPHLPELRLGEPELPDRLWVVLEHLARYESVRRLENPDLTSPLYGMVELRFEPHPEETGLPLERLDTYPPQVEVGSTLVLAVENLSRFPLHVAVLDLCPDWGIVKVFPSDSGSRLVDPHGRWRISLQADLPPGLEDGTDTLKLLAATEPLDCGWMELPPLVGTGLEDSEDPTGAGFRWRSHRPRAWRSALGRRHRTRAGGDEFREGAWATVQKELRVVCR